MRRLTCRTRQSQTFPNRYLSRWAGQKSCHNEELWDQFHLYMDQSFVLGDDNFAFVLAHCVVEKCKGLFIVDVHYAATLQAHHSNNLEKSPTHKIRELSVFYT